MGSASTSTSTSFTALLFLFFLSLYSSATYLDEALETLVKPLVGSDYAQATRRPLASEADIRISSIRRRCADYLACEYPIAGAH